MEKIIKIGDKEVRLNNNVAWTMEYRDQFGKDIVPALIPLLATFTEGIASVVAESDGQITAKNIAEAVQGRTTEILLPLFQVQFVDIIINVTWAMAKAADESIKPPKQWVREFDRFPLDEIIPAVYKLAMEGFSSSKNWERLKSLVDNLKNLQPSLSMTSSSQDSNED